MNKEPYDKVNELADKYSKSISKVDTYRLYLKEAFISGYLQRDKELESTKQDNK